jgi:hypothetical protein
MLDDLEGAEVLLCAGPVAKGPLCPLGLPHAATLHTGVRAVGE